MKTVDRDTYDRVVLKLDWSEYKDVLYSYENGRKAIRTIRLVDQVVVAVEEYGGDQPYHFEILEGLK